MSCNDELTYAFFGSGAFAARCLELLAQWRPPLWAVTAPPKPAGRGRLLRDTPVKDLCGTMRELMRVPLLTSSGVSCDEAVLSMKSSRPVSFSFVVDFGQIIREPLLAWDAPIGCLNIHPSLLPFYRGAAPVQRALMDGAEQTGVTIFKLASGTDNGPVLLRETIAVEKDDDTGTLLERAALAGVSAFIDHASRVPMSEWRFTPQDDARATRAPKISKDEERIDWSKSAREIEGKVRALSPEPGAWTTVRGKRLRVLKAHAVNAGVDSGRKPGALSGMAGGLPLVAAGDGAVALAVVQLEGKAQTGAAQWWNGLRAAKEESLA